MMRFGTLLAVVTLSPLLVRGRNNWNKPCFDGHCSYDLQKPDGSVSGILKISGSPDAISDITPAAGWTILGCDPNAEAQDIRLVCTSTNATDCKHLYRKIGAAGKLVRLPEDCGKSAFARVVRNWVHKNQTIPSHIRHRLSRRGTDLPQVQGLQLDTNFAAIDPAQVGKVSLFIQGSTVPGAASDMTVTPVKSLKKRHRRLRHRGWFDDITDTIKGGIDTVVDTVEDGVDSVGDALQNLNNVSGSKTANIAPIDVNKNFPVFSKSMSCPARSGPSVTASVDVSVDTSVHAVVQVGVSAKGTLIPPHFDDFGLFAGIDADFSGSLNLAASVSGTVDSGLISFFEVGLPGLDIPGILSLGPVFRIQGQAKATLESDLNLKLGMAYSAKGVKLNFPQSSQPSGGGFSPGNSPLKLSVDPSISVKGSVEAHLIPRVEFGVTALGGFAKATVFMDLDAYAALSLNLNARASVSTTINPIALPSASSSSVYSSSSIRSTSSLIPSSSAHPSSSSSSSVQSSSSVRPSSSVLPSSSVYSSSSPLSSSSIHPSTSLLPSSSIHPSSSLVPSSSLHSSTSLLSSATPSSSYPHISSSLLPYSSVHSSLSSTAIPLSASAISSGRPSTSSISSYVSSATQLSSSSIILSANSSTSFYPSASRSSSTPSASSASSRSSQAYPSGAVTSSLSSSLPVPSAAPSDAIDISPITSSAADDSSSAIPVSSSLSYSQPSSASGTYSASESIVTTVSSSLSESGVISSTLVSLSPSALPSLAPSGVSTASNVASVCTAAPTVTVTVTVTAGQGSSGVASSSPVPATQSSLGSVSWDSPGTIVPPPTRPSAIDSVHSSPAVYIAPSVDATDIYTIETVLPTFGAGSGADTGVYTIETALPNTGTGAGAADPTLVGHAGASPPIAAPGPSSTKPLCKTRPAGSVPTPAPAGYARSQGLSKRAASVSFDGCLEVTAGFDVHAGADAAFFSLFNPSTKISLFSKKFEIYKKCFGSGTTVKREPAAPASTLIGAQHDQVFEKRDLSCILSSLSGLLGLVDEPVPASSIQPL